MRAHKAPPVACTVDRSLLCSCFIEVFYLFLFVFGRLRNLIATLQIPYFYIIARTLLSVHFSDIVTLFSDSITFISLSLICLHGFPTRCKLDRSSEVKIEIEKEIHV